MSADDRFCAYCGAPIAPVAGGSSSAAASADVPPAEAPAAVGPPSAFVRMPNGRLRCCHCGHENADVRRTCKRCHVDLRPSGDPTAETASPTDPHGLDLRADDPDAVGLAAIRAEYRRGLLEVGVDMTAARTWVQQGSGVPPGARFLSYALLQGPTFVGLPLLVYLAWGALGWPALGLAVPFLFAQFVMTPIGARVVPQLGLVFWGAVLAAAGGALGAQPLLLWPGLSVVVPAACTHWLYKHASGTARSRILADPEVFRLFSAVGTVDVREAQAGGG